MYSVKEELFNIQNKIKLFPGDQIIYHREFWSPKNSDYHFSLNTCMKIQVQYTINVQDQHEPTV